MKKKCKNISDNISISTHSKCTVDVSLLWTTFSILCFYRYNRALDCNFISNCKFLQTFQNCRYFTNSVYSLGKFCWSVKLLHICAQPVMFLISTVIINGRLLGDDGVISIFSNFTNIFLILIFN